MPSLLTTNSFGEPPMFIVTLSFGFMVRGKFISTFEVPSPISSPLIRPSPFLSAVSVTFTVSLTLLLGVVLVAETLPNLSTTPVSMLLPAVMFAMFGTLKLTAPFSSVVNV